MYYVYIYIYIYICIMYIYIYICANVPFRRVDPRLPGCPRSPACLAADNVTDNHATDTDQTTNNNTNNTITNNTTNNNTTNNNTNKDNNNNNKKNKTNNNNHTFFRLRACPLGHDIFTPARDHQSEIREMGGAPRNPAPRNHFLVWIVKPSGCHCADVFLVETDIPLGLRRGRMLRRSARSAAAFPARGAERGYGGRGCGGARLLFSKAQIVKRYSERCCC